MDFLTITTNPWRVPSVEHAFDGWLEGLLTDEERTKIIKATTVARRAWKPSPEAMPLVARLTAFVGCRVRIQFWDPCMYALDEEAPYPVDISCDGIVLLQDGGHLQAYIECSDLLEHPTPEGYTSHGYFKHKGGYGRLAPLADIYMIRKVA